MGCKIISENSVFSHFSINGNSKIQTEHQVAKDELNLESHIIKVHKYNPFAVKGCKISCKVKSVNLLIMEASIQQLCHKLFPYYLPTIFIV